MFCPFCSRVFEGTGSKYCPYCGQDISEYTTVAEKGRSLINGLRKRFYDNDPQKAKVIITTGLIAVLVLIVALVAVTVYDGDSDNQTSLPRGYVPISDNEFIQLGGDYLTGELSAYMNDAKQFIIYLDAEIAEKNEKYVWVLRDEQYNDYQIITKHESELIWLEPEIGNYNVLVYCYEHEDSETYSECYTGSMLYIGDLDKMYVWDFHGKTVRINTHASAEEIAHYKTESILPVSVRHGIDKDRITDLVVTSGAVHSLENALSRCYELYFGDAEGYGYAEFILSFIRENVEYDFDIVNYSHSDYWSYPLETLHMGCGDQEDLAILYASLLKAAGYDVGLMFVPNNVIVGIDITVPSDVVCPENSHSVMIRHDGRTYAMANTSPESDDPIGFLDDRYGISIDGKTFTFYGDVVEGDYGFHACK